MILISRIKPLVVLMIVILLPFSLIMYGANIVFSNVHLSALLTEVEVSEQIMEDAKSNLKINLVENTGGKCLRVAVVGRQYCGYSEWDALVRDFLSPAYLKVQSDLELQDFIIGDSEQFPFGGEFAKPKKAYHQHMRAWIDLYKRLGACKDYRCFYPELIKPTQITTTFHIAERTFSNVVPIFDFKGSKKRIIQIFKN